MSKSYAERLRLIRRKWKSGETFAMTTIFLTNEKPFKT